ncbi:MAG: ABC transporter ATP-binding protein [Thermodesulfovibrionia bacterium]
MAHSETVLTFDKVCFSYERDRMFIEDMNLAIRNGEFIGLLGANGSGKSTILKLTSGLLKPSDGSIGLWGKPINLYRHKDRAKLISYLPQILDINVPFTVREVISMGLYPYDIPPQLTVDDAIDMVGLRDRADYPITMISGGERRRTYIAMTLLQGAGVILLDEPLANLDIRYQVEIMRLLRGLVEVRGLTVVMALHDINLAMQFDRIILLKDGRLMGVGMPSHVLDEKAIKEVFDVDVEIIREGNGGIYIRCI